MGGIDLVQTFSFTAINISISRAFSVASENCLLEKKIVAFLCAIFVGIMCNEPKISGI